MIYFDICRNNKNMKIGRETGFQVLKNFQYVYVQLKNHHFTST